METLLTTSFRDALTTVLKIASIMSLRVIGIFMILPIISLYASQFEHANGLLIGMATGIYGLSQALLQIPFGILSDRYGRKTLVFIGLCLFILGSLTCALSESIYLLIVGRLLQGAGAIGSVLIALIADTTPEYHLGKAMAVIGITMGTSFLVAFSIGPYVQLHFGVPALFYLAALFGFVAILVLLNLKSVPTLRTHRVSLREIKAILKNPNLFRINTSIFLQHAILTASFVVMPFVMRQFHITLWNYYFSLLFAAFVFALPLIRYAENQGYMRQLLLFAITSSLIGQAWLFFTHQQLWWFTPGLFIYFFGFSLLEAILPACASKLAPASDRGCALGVYSSSQFLGLFCGGTLGGLMVGLGLKSSIFLLNAGAATLWLVLSMGIKFKQSQRKFD